jgi:hypothetical protein
MVRIAKSFRDSAVRHLIGQSVFLERPAAFTAVISTHLESP